MENEQLSGSVHVRESHHRYEGPPHKLLEHEHPHHTGSKSSSETIAHCTDINIIAIFTAGDVRPVLLNRGLVEVDSSIENVFVEVLHA